MIKGKKRYRKHYQTCVPRIKPIQEIPEPQRKRSVGFTPDTSEKSFLTRENRPSTLCHRVPINDDLTDLMVIQQPRNPMDEVILEFKTAIEKGRMR